jgi:nitrogen fixation protein NifQ
MNLQLQAPPARDVGVSNMRGLTATRGDVLAEAYAHVIATYCNPLSSAFVPALGLELHNFLRLLQAYFPQFTPSLNWLSAQNETPADDNELNGFHDLLQLLLDHRAAADERHLRIAHLVACACMGNDHLWQDLGLPDRKALSALLAAYFPALAARNTGNMKWKKFFYKQLCEREGVNTCRAPSCAVCDDYNKCFGSEE